MSAPGGDEFQSVFASGLERRRGRDLRREEWDEEGGDRQETRLQDGVTVQMPNPLRDCEPFFLNKHNSHTENHSWRMVDYS